MNELSEKGVALVRENLEKVEDIVQDKLIGIWFIKEDVPQDILVIYNGQSARALQVRDWPRVEKTFDKSVGMFGPVELDNKENVIGFMTTFNEDKLKRLL